MSPAAVIQSRLEALLAKITSWADIDEFLELADKDEIWTEEFLENSLITAKKSELRRLARLKKYRGTKLELISVVRTDERGQQKRFYKQLDLFDIGDFSSTIRDRITRRNYWAHDIQRLYKLAQDRFGDAAKVHLLPLLFDQS